MWDELRRVVRIDPGVFAERDARYGTVDLDRSRIRQHIDVE
jgi:transcription antitermination factor NusG